MACKGALPKPQCAIFADTGWEPADVYSHLSWLEEMGREHGIPVHRVAKGNIRNNTLLGTVRGLKADGGRTSLPFFVSHNNSKVDRTAGRFLFVVTFQLRAQGDDADGLVLSGQLGHAMAIAGRLGRQCTKEYKIEPIHTFIKREILGLKPRQRTPNEPIIESWRGISKDEVYRVRMSRERWAITSYPLIGIPFDYLDHPYTRQDCILWLREHYPDRVVPRSSCLGCPFHSDAEWRQLKENPDEWADITEFDRAIRKLGAPRGDCYLHRSLRPIEDVDFRNAEDQGQLRLWNEECEGMCGV